MTDPGSIEKVPIKIVPMYIEIEPVDDVESEPIEVEVEPEERPKTALIGGLALTAALAVVVLDVAAILLATNALFATATVLAYLAIALSVVAVVGGIVAVVLDRGRRLGVAAAVIGLLANPYLMLVGLDMLSGIRA